MGWDAADYEGDGRPLQSLANSALKGSNSASAIVSINWPSKTLREPASCYMAGNKLPWRNTGKLLGWCIPLRFRPNHPVQIIVKSSAIIEGFPRASIVWAWTAGALCWLAGCAETNRLTPSGLPAQTLESLRSDPALVRRLMALNPERITSRDVAEVLSKCPAPRILNFNGSAFRTMDEFSRFLMDMGYPEASVRDPASGALSRSSFQSTRKIAREILAVCRDDGLRPMLIGHSQGGAFVIQVLHELEGQPVCYAAAIATGQWMRIALGQWNRIPILRKVPDSVEEFSGYWLSGDFLGSDVPGLAKSAGYEAEGCAKVHNLRLRGAGHIGIVGIRPLAREPAARRWLDSYSPGTTVPKNAKMLFAADLWHYITKHWCLELQRAFRFSAPWLPPSRASGLCIPPPSPPGENALTLSIR